MLFMTILLFWVVYEFIMVVVPNTDKLLADNVPLNTLFPVNVLLFANTVASVVFVST